MIPGYKLCHSLNRADCQNKRAGCTEQPGNHGKKQPAGQPSEVIWKTLWLERLSLNEQYRAYTTNAATFTQAGAGQVLNTMPNCAGLSGSLLLKVSQIVGRAAFVGGQVGRPARREVGNESIADRHGTDGKQAAGRMRKQMGRFM